MSNSISNVNDVFGEYSSIVKNSQTGTNELGQDDFLKLLTTQLQNQDPTKPLDNNEFISQMTQFSSLDNLQKMVQQNDLLTTSLTSNQALQASTLVGREVLVPSEIGVIKDTGNLQGVIHFERNTEAAVIQISDQYGQLVYQASLDSQPAGDLAFDWDGSGVDGNRVPSGRYHISVIGNVAGENQQIATSLYSTVDSVSLNSVGSGIQINVNGVGTVPLTEVKEIGQ